MVLTAILTTIFTYAVYAICFTMLYVLVGKMVASP